MFKKYEKGQESGCYTIFVLVLFMIELLWGPVMGSLVHESQAQQVAQSNLSMNAEIGARSVWFVAYKGCDASDVALFEVKPYIGLDGKTVDNAIICSGFPFKGMTVRFK